jgi:hypothetical protein
LIFIPVVAVFCSVILAAQTSSGKQASGQSTGAGSDFVGSDTCITCHEKVGKAFTETPHSKMAELHGNNGVTCENCHGSGKAHVESGGDIAKIFNPAKHTTKEVDGTCLTCHREAHPNFDRSPHAKANVRCARCPATQSRWSIT